MASDFLHSISNLPQDLQHSQKVGSTPHAGKVPSFNDNIINSDPVTDKIPPSENFRSRSTISDKKSCAPMNLLILSTGPGIKSCMLSYLPLLPHSPSPSASQQFPHRLSEDLTTGYKPLFRALYMCSKVQNMNFPTDSEQV